MGRGETTLEPNTSNRSRLYDNSRSHSTLSISNSYYLKTYDETAATSTKPVELIYTPASPQIITEFESWSRRTSSGTNDNQYPKTIKVYGYTGSQYVSLCPLLAHRPYIVYTFLRFHSNKRNSLHSMTFNSTKTSYQKYKIKMYDSFNTSYNNIVIGELNLRGYTRSTELTSTEFNASAFRVNNTPLITQVHSFHTSFPYAVTGHWMAHATGYDANNSSAVIGMKAVVNMKPYAVSFGSTDDPHTTVDAVFHIMEADSETTDMSMSTSTATNIGTATFYDVSGSTSKYVTIDNPGTIRAGRNFGVYIWGIGTAPGFDFQTPIVVKVYFYQV